MNCFNHPSVPAVGICKACQKGLCMECAVDLVHGIACKNHREDVELINDIQLYSKRAIQNTGGLYRQVSMAFLFIGIVMVLGGLSMGSYGSILVFVGIGVFAFSAIYLGFGNRFVKNKSNQQLK